MLASIHQILGTPTTQDMFIFQALESGMTVHPVKALVRVQTDRVTRISKLRPKKAVAKAPK